MFCTGWVSADESWYDPELADAFRVVLHLVDEIRLLLTDKLALDQCDVTLYIDSDMYQKLSAVSKSLPLITYGKL